MSLQRTDDLGGRASLRESATASALALALVLGFGLAGEATAATPKLGKFLGSAEAPYDFGLHREKQDVQFYAKRHRVLVGIYYLGCSAFDERGVKENFLVSATMRAKVSKTGKVSGKATTTKGDLTVTQTISGTFISPTRVRGTIKATYTDIGPQRGADTCTVGGRWSAKRLKSQ